MWVILKDVGSGYLQCMHVNMTHMFGYFEHKVVGCIEQAPKFCNTNIQELY